MIWSFSFSVALKKGFWNMFQGKERKLIEILLYKSWVWWLTMIKMCFLSIYQLESYSRCDRSCIGYLHFHNGGSSYSNKNEKCTFTAVFIQRDFFFNISFYITEQVRIKGLAQEPRGGLLVDLGLKLLSVVQHRHH